MAKLLPANRVAAISTWLTALASFIVGVTGTFPHSWQNTAAVVGGLLTKAVVALKFMDGSQKYDALVAGSADKQMQAPAGVGTANAANTTWSVSTLPFSDAEELEEGPPESAMTPDQSDLKQDQAPEPSPETELRP